MRRTLAPRRDTRLGPSGEVYLSNDRWIKEGKVTDDDIFPWLRPMQVQGFELTIVGSSLGAVRVCMEAWNAGFRPVLIFMEDPVHTCVTAEMRQLLRKLSRFHGGAGMFTYGPRMIISEGPRCLVQLDHKGRATDVIVCTNNGGLHTLAETWEFFSGPAIIVDDVCTVNGVEPPSRAAVHDDRVSSCCSDAKHGHFAAGQPVSDVERPPPAVVQDKRSLFWSDANQDDRRSLFPGGAKEEHCASGQPVPTAIHDSRRSVFLSKLKQERSTIVDPKFWEDRYDPERLPFWALGYREIAPNLLAGLAMMFARVALSKHAKDNYYYMMRALADLIEFFPWANGVVTIYCAMLGLQLRHDRPTVLSVCFGVGHWLIIVQYYVTPVIRFQFAFVYLLAAPLVFCKCVKHTKVTMPMLLWYCAFAFISGFSWDALIGILQLYLELLSWNRVIASVFLAVAFSVMDAAVVKLMLLCYSFFVWQPRRSQPHRVPGDQKLPLAMCVIGIHCYTETGRLVSMICGAVRAEDVTFIYTNAVAVFLGFVINVAIRSGWASCKLVRCVGPRFRPCVEYLLCPTAVQGLHTDARFAIGWLRFFMMAGVWLGRGWIHSKWSLTMTGRDPSVWCWNGIVLVTTLMAFLSEIAEDWVVYAVARNLPPPLWECFSSAMLNRFDRPHRDDIFHPSHYIVPQSAFLAPSADTTKAPSLKRATVKSRMHRASTKFVQDLAPALSVSPNCKHARYLTAFQLQMYVSGSITLIIVGMRTGLGNGSLYGFCMPVGLDTTAISVDEATLDGCDAPVVF